MKLREIAEAWGRPVRRPSDIRQILFSGPTTTPDGIDSRELNLGIEVENFNYNDLEQAKKVAINNLKMDPKYYSKSKSIKMG